MLINITRNGVNYKINSLTASVSSFTDAQGNVTYQASIAGLGSLSLSADEYQQFVDNNAQIEGVE